MKKLQIDEKEALKLYPKASDEMKSIFESTFGKDFFKPKNIWEIVNDEDSLAEYLNIETEDLFVFKENTKNKEERYLNACRILPKIARVYNEETILNWNNASEEKWFCYKDFCLGRGGVVEFDLWFYNRLCPAGFYYKNQNLNKKAYENFKIYFEDYLNYHE